MERRKRIRRSQKVCEARNWKLAGQAPCADRLVLGMRYVELREGVFDISVIAAGAPGDRRVEEAIVRRAQLDFDAGHAAVGYAITDTYGLPGERGRLAPPHRTRWAPRPEDVIARISWDEGDRVLKLGNLGALLEDRLEAA